MPAADVALEITGLPNVTVRVRVLFPVPPAFVAPSVIVLLPTAVGVPEINPVAVLTFKPVGNPVAL